MGTRTAPQRNPTDAAAPLTVVALLVLALVMGRQLWFFSDDWNIFAGYASGNLLEPFNGHLSLVPAGIYQALFHTAGVGSYLPYRLCGLVALGILGFQLVRHCRGVLGPWAAALATAAVLWNSFGTTNVLFPFLMNFSLPIAALVAIWWHLDRTDDAAGTVHLVAIGLWMALALGASGLGLMALAAVVAELAVRRASMRTWLAIVPAAALWLIWWLGHREANDISTDLGEVVPYFLRMLWASGTSVAAGWKPAGLVLTAAALVWIAAALVQAWRSDSPRDTAAGARVLGALVAALAFAGLTALTRQDVTPPVPPDELRYGWTIAAYLVLATVSAVPLLRPRPRTAGAGTESAEGASADGGSAENGPVEKLGRAAFAVAAVVLVLGGVRLVSDMADWTDLVADAAPGLRSNIYAAEAIGTERLESDALIRPLSFVPVTASAYLESVAEVGSPLAGAGPDEIGGRPDQRLDADGLLFGSLRLELSDATPPRPQRCSTSVDAPPGSTVAVVPGAAPTGTDSEGPPVVTVRRFADEALVEFAVEIDGELGGQARSLELPDDASVGTTVEVPYVVEGLGGVTVCR